MNFGLIGAAGYIAPKHLQAIRDTGNKLVAATDPHDCVGKLDSFFPECDFDTSIERFERLLEQRRRSGDPIEYVSICSPNYLHDAHARLALRAGANAICEKPLVIEPRDLDELEALESEHGRRVYTVLQLRLLPSLLALREELHAATPREKAVVDLTYITRRGRWYDASWKGAAEKSGGVAMNIGIHFFDLLGWLFGGVEASELHLQGKRRMAGRLEFDRASVRWFLSTDAADLPQAVTEKGGYAHRSMTLDGQEIEFSGGFTDLHTRVYEEILAGRGSGVRDARPAVELAHRASNAQPTTNRAGAHPFVAAQGALPSPAAA